MIQYIIVQNLRYVGRGPQDHQVKMFVACYAIVKFFILVI